MKKYFPYMSRHKIYREEAVGLISSNTLKITIFMNMWNLGQFRKNLIVSITLEFESKNPSAHMWHTYDCEYLPHTTFHFYLIDFQMNTDYPSGFGFLS